MKYIRLNILVISFLLLINNGYGQKYANNARVCNLQFYDTSPYHFGFILGVDKMAFSLSQDTNYRSIDTLNIVQPIADYGFHIGIISNLRLGTFLDLRFIPTIAFGERKIYYNYIKNNEKIDEYKKVESDILYFPFQIKYKSARINNARVYIIGGGGYTFDLASQSKKKKFTTEEDVLKLNRSDFMFEGGLGFDFYLVYFKFGTELKFAAGLRDILKKEDNMYTSPIERLNSKLILLSFTFE